MRQLNAAALLLFLCLSACATRNAQGPGAHGAAPDGLAKTPYYVEFHSRPSIITGHTYLVYGAQNAQGEPLDRQVIGFVPLGGIVGLFGGIIAAPGRVEKAYLDERLPDVNSYRTNLTQAQYQKLTQFIAKEESKTKVWSMFVNNCNDFAAEAAEVVGLKVPSGRYVPPPLFIMELSDLNT